MTGRGIPDVAATIDAFRKALTESGEIAAHRRAQAGLWFQRELGLSILERLAEDADLTKILADLERDVLHGKTSPATAARQVVDRLMSIQRITQK